MRRNNYKIFNFTTRKVFFVDYLRKKVEDDENSLELIQDE